MSNPKGAMEGQTMTEHAGEIVDLSDKVPTYADEDRAAMWRDAKAANADIWTMLSDDQRAAIERRIAWVDEHIGRHLDHEEGA